MADDRWKVPEALTGADSEPLRLPNVYKRLLFSIADAKIARNPRFSTSAFGHKQTSPKLSRFCIEAQFVKEELSHHAWVAWAVEEFLTPGWGVDVQTNVERVDSVH